MSELKVGDKVRISKKHSECCNASHYKYINKIGVVFAISEGFSNLPITVKFGDNDNDNDIWHHNKSCLEKVYDEGFNPEDIISQAFGV